MTWLYLPSNCLPASECLAKVSEQDLLTWASRIAPFASLSGKLTQPASWSRAWKKAPWMRHLSGPMFAPSTQEHGTEKWIASLPDSPVRIYPSPVAASDSTASGPDCSSRLSGLQPIAVRGASFWRTSQASLLPPPPLWTKPKANSTNARPPESWENWPTAGGIRNGSLFQHPTWAPATAAQGGSASHGVRQTPKASEEESGSGMNSRGEPKLKAQSINWATPDCNAATYSNGIYGQNIREQATQWATPTSSENSNRGNKMAPTHGKGHGLVLAGQAGQWPTPAARDYKGTNSGQHATVTGGGGKHMDQLANFVAYSPLAQATRDGQESSNDSPKSPRHLNPLFGAWLMGWPSTWVIAEPHASSALETALWRSTLQSHLSCLLDEPESLNKEAA